MNVRSAVAAFLLVLASSACSASRPAAQAPAAQGAAAATPKAVCQNDQDCSPYHSCNSDGHCRCDVNEDCATSQACRAGICLPR